MYLVEASFIKDDHVIIDCRYDMTNPAYGPKAYSESHVKGAYYIDLEKDMTASLGQHGGRHPMKDLLAFTEKIGSFGITNQTVVIYDDGDMPMASRLWFMLRLIGLKEVYIIKGGFNKLKDQVPLTQELPQTYTSQLEMHYQSDLIVDMETVKAAINNEDIAIVDSRANERYRGLVEPFDKIAGRIPSAVNYFWKDNFIESDPTKKAKDYGQIEANFLGLDQKDQVFVHCGSGITGCVNMFFMNEIGIKSKLYLGSYSDWISYDDNEIVVKDNIRRTVKI